MNGKKTLLTDYKSGSITVRKASISDFPALERMLARAFDDDPMVNWVCLQDRHRAQRIIRWMNLGLQLAAPFGEIYTTQDQAGAALWTPAGKTDIGFREVLMLLPKVIRIMGAKRVVSGLIVLNITQKRRPKRPHWHLMYLGTEPSLQAKGIGSALLQPILNQCDQEHLPAYLEAQKERNIPFYEHRGFKVIERIKLPYGAPDCWFMLREPLR